jgi:hypothetical protein
MKLLILSTHPTIHRWRLLDGFLKVVTRCIPGIQIKIERIKLPEVKVVKERIDHTWLQNFKAPYLAQGHSIIGLHFSKSQWVKLGLKSSLRGANPKRTNKVQDFYFWADERSKRFGLPQFVQTLLHELLHEYFQQKGIEDLTHQWHEENRDITKRFPIKDIDIIL